MSNIDDPISSISISPKMWSEQLAVTNGSDGSTVRNGLDARRDRDETLLPGSAIGNWM